MMKQVENPFITIKRTCIGHIEQECQLESNQEISKVTVYGRVIRNEYKLLGIFTWRTYQKIITTDLPGYVKLGKDKVAVDVKIEHVNNEMNKLIEKDQ